MIALLTTLRRDLADTLRRLRHPAAASMVPTATAREWRIIAADVATRTTTHDQRTAAAAQDAAESLSKGDVDGAARRMAALCGLSVAEWAARVEAETPVLAQVQP